jgi:hypothetical protein
MVFSGLPFVHGEGMETENFVCAGPPGTSRIMLFVWRLSSSIAIAVCAFWCLRQYLDVRRVARLIDENSPMVIGGKGALPDITRIAVEYGLIGFVFSVLTAFAAGAFVWARACSALETIFATVLACAVSLGVGSVFSVAVSEYDVASLKWGHT